MDKIINLMWHTKNVIIIWKYFFSYQRQIWLLNYLMAHKAGIFEAGQIFIKGAKSNKLPVSLSVIFLNPIEIQGWHGWLVGGAAI